MNKEIERPYSELLQERVDAIFKDSNYEIKISERTDRLDSTLEPEIFELELPGVPLRELNRLSKLKNK